MSLKDFEMFALPEKPDWQKGYNESVAIKQSRRLCRNSS